MKTYWLKCTILPVFVLAMGIASSRGQGVSEEEYYIQWGQPKTIFDADSLARKTLNIQGAVYLKENGYLPTLQSMRSVGSAQVSVSVDSVVYGEFSNEELDILNKSQKLDFKTVSTKVLRSRDDDFLKTGILPIDHDPPGGFRKIIYLKLGLHYGNLKKSFAARRQSSTFNSVLATGHWFKVAVSKDGVYKIDYDFLKKAGVDVESLDPRKLRVFGNGCKMLPQANSAPRAEDLTENAIFVQGEGDGHFDKGDYLLFYGQSPDTHYFEEPSGKLVYNKNLYSDTTFYFVNYGEANGLRIESRTNAGSGFPLVDSYDFYDIHELDKVNILSSGRYWYGEEFEFNPGYDFDIQIPDLLPNTEIKVVSSVMAETYAPASMDLSLNGQTLGNQPLQSVYEGTYSQKGTDNLDSFKINSNSVVANAANSYTLSLKFNRANASRSRAYLNYFIVSAKCGLTLHEDQLIFTSLSSVGQPISTYQISGATPTTHVWDVTDPLKPVAQQYTLTGERAVFGVGSSTLRSFVVFKEGNFSKPILVGQVPNQNLHAETAPDLLIVSYPAFLPEAERLASLRQQNDGLDVLVVTTNQVYNEFSSGAQDVTAIRDFVRFLYDQSPDAHKLKNLLLFGRCSFDYKNRINHNTDFVPTYSSRNSLHPIGSYSSDDYYGFLDEGEGNWTENSSGDELLDIGVGRLPVKSPEEAHIVVDKLYNYAENPETFGSWRNDICFVADDGDNQDGTLHERDADKLATLVDTAFSSFSTKKIYIDAYPQVISPVGESAPEANEALEGNIDKGLLIVNYTGHGSETRLASETILNISSISKLKNYRKLPLFVTATCEFGRHDNPKIVSGAEYLILNPEGGAIGLLTTSRPVYASSNFVLNEAFYQHVFQKNAGHYQDLGTIFMQTKNESLRGTVNRNFILLGDPSMKLAYPERHIRLLADKSAYSPGDTLKALNTIKLTGEVLDESGNVDASFNGQLEATAFDKESVKTTLGNRTPVMQYNERDNAIFRGLATVKDGKFELGFVVSKNISYNFGLGKISLYAVDKDHGIDANGANLEFVVGGSGKGTEDNMPPNIKLYINDTTFHDGGITGKNVLLLARLDDESGINLSKQGFGQGITAVLDNDQKFELNDYYLSNIDSYKTGWVTFPISDLSIGNHAIRLMAWDTHNNYSESGINFLVVGDSHLKISNLISYPNPFTDRTTISFEQNRAGDDLEITADIYSIEGKKICSLQMTDKKSGSRISNIVWDGRDQLGRSVGPGLYILKLFVRSLLDGAKISANEKLVLIK